MHSRHARPANGAVREEGHDLERAHLLWMALAVKQDEAADPVGVGVLGAAREVAQPRGLADALEESRRLSRGGRQRESGCGTGLDQTVATRSAPAHLAPRPVEPREQRLDVAALDGG